MRVARNIFGFISIHALREEGDVVMSDAAHPDNISIHALREEGDACWVAHLSPLWYFYPRPPRGGRPLASRQQLSSTGISIHALREEGDRG